VISPVLYVAVVVLLAAALYRWRERPQAWALAVALVVLAYPRLLVYQLTTLLAAFGGPKRTDDPRVVVDRPVNAPVPIGERP
jgi:hypothetical protein